MTDWTTKTVLVSGGSRGLGWHIGKAFAQRGSHVVLVARDPAGLDAARCQMGDNQTRVTTLAADITQPHIGELFQAHLNRYCQGRLDMLVNCAGKSARGRAAETTPEQFQAMWELNFLATVRCTQAALPFLRRSQGHLVNIGSLASKSPGWYLGPYPVSKYAVAAYSHQLRLELKSEGIGVLLVCPGPIKRDDAGERYADQAAQLPPAARAPGGGARLRGIDPAQLAERIVRGCERGDAELVIPGKARWLFAIGQLVPSLGDWLLNKFTRSSAGSQSSAD